MLPTLYAIAGVAASTAPQLHSLELHAPQPQPPTPAPEPPTVPSSLSHTAVVQHHQHQHQHHSASSGGGASGLSGSKPCGFSTQDKFDIVDLCFRTYTTPAPNIEPIRHIRRCTAASRYQARSSHDIIVHTPVYLVVNGLRDVRAAFVDGIDLFSCSPESRRVSCPVISCPVPLDLPVLVCLIVNINLLLTYPLLVRLVDVKDHLLVHAGEALHDRRFFFGDTLATRTQNTQPTRVRAMWRVVDDTSTLPHLA